MPRSSSAHATAERLLLLTLSLEESICADDAVSTRDLLAARDDALRDLEGCGVGPEIAGLLGRVRSAEERVLGAMQARRSRVMAELVQCNKRRRKVGGYAACAAVQAASFSRIG